MPRANSIFVCSPRERIYDFVLNRNCNLQKRYNRVPTYSSYTQKLLTATMVYVCVCTRVKLKKVNAEN